MTQRTSYTRKRFMFFIIGLLVTGSVLGGFLIEIDAVASQRGDIGASVNRLTASSNVMTAQVQNLTSAENSIMNADVGKTVANMTQYNILESTGMAALQQANQSQQSVLKLLQ